MIDGYANREWERVAKDAAFYNSTIFQENRNWHRKNYWVNTGVVQMAGGYPDRETSIQAGILTDSFGYANGREIQVFWLPTPHPERFCDF